MNLEKNNIIEFKDGKYLILDVIKNNENTYLYLINNSKSMNDVSIVKVINDENKVYFNHIDDDKEFDFVMNKIFVNFGESILKILSKE